MGLPRENVYTCQVGHMTLTVDVDEGCTPFMIGCTHPGCKSSAVSAMYPRGPKPVDYPKPSHEWYKPSHKETKKLDPAAREHVRKGGLLMRKRTSAKPVYHKDRRDSREDERAAAKAAIDAERQVRAESGTSDSAFRTKIDDYFLNRKLA